MRRLLPLLLLLMASPAMAGEDLLPPQKAYLYSAEAGPDAITLRWDIQPGYYLYRDKFGFSSQSEGITLGEPRLPQGKRKIDEFFGEMEIYRGRLDVVIPVQRSASAAHILQLEIRSQGCADIGICFPPQNWLSEISLPPAPRPAVAKTAVADLFGLQRDALGQNEILPPEQAFILSAEMASPGLLRARWEIAPGHYLYRDKFRFRADLPEVQLGSAQFPDGQFKEDEYFGRSEVYFSKVEVLIPVAVNGQSPDEFLLQTESQGCKEDGICYSPFEQEAPIALARFAAAPADSAVSALRRPQKISRQDQLARLISDTHIASVMLTFFGLGLLLAFTPCVLPMVPILSGIIAGQGDRVSTRRAFLLSLTYVLGMALTYTAAGATAALFGQQFQAIFQQPWIIVTFAALFVVLALSMFGLYELQMPAALQSRLADASNKQRAGTYVGTAIMGVLSALIVTACVAPPLVATLAVIGQAGEPARGALALFAMSLGMGAPLLLVGASAGKLLPRAGAWMNAVKAAFGVMLLAVAIWMLERVLPHAITMFMWGALLVVTGIFMVAPATPGASVRGWKRLWRGIGVIMTAYGLLMLVGVAAGGSDTWRPLRGTGLTGAATPVPHGLAFRRIKTIADLDAALVEASARGQATMLDFYADWCVSCLEMEKYTFGDPRVQAALSDTLLLQADVTANDDQDQALLKRFRIYGPPTIAFYAADGVELEGFRVVGFMPADDFTAHVSEALNAGSQ